jgi:excisionase family DNA binding protein
MKTYTLQEAAAFAKCHPETFRQLIKIGKAPGIKVGRRYVILEAELDTYLRGEYVGRGQAAAETWSTACPSTNLTTQAVGTLISQAPVVSELDALLAPVTNKRRKNCMTV